MRIFLLLALLFSFNYAISLEERYPTYSYVFNEFDIDESYIYEESFVRFVNSHEKSLKSFYKSSLKRGKSLVPIVQGLLVKDNISDLFIYISIVESGLSTDIVSPKKAVGLWQFMPKTAKYYNLDISNIYDERCDTLFSTSAAIKYLRRLHKKFKKWYLAIMAYNCGEGRLEKAIKRAGSDELAILTDDTLKYLPKETRDYIRKIILVSMIGENSHIDFSSVDYNREFVKVEVKGGTSLKKLAKRLNMSTKRVLSLNRSFKNGTIPIGKKRYKILIPLDKIYEFYLQDNYDVEDSKKENLYMVSYIVKLGDTLESIAKHYSVNIDKIKDINKLDSDYLVVGSILFLYVTKTTFDTVSK